ncbi:MAG TPA: DUF4956 domain-containing protein [Longimicrobiales bacterium]
MTWDETRFHSGREGLGRPPSSAREPRRAPFLRLLAYYAAVVALAALLARHVPAIRDALVAPITPAPIADGRLPAAAAPVTPASAPDRALTTALAIIGTLALVLPIAWVYRYTRGLRSDRSLIQSMIVLPLVVAGIVIVVKNSLALAFSLAGIVAAVRFRNTLKDPRDAVYVFLAIGLGLAAGVQALDVALVVSFAFNLIVLVTWAFDAGGVEAVAAEGALAVGDGGLRVADGAEQRGVMRAELPARASDMEADGILLLHSPDPDAALEGLDAALSDEVKEWRVVGTRPNTDGITTLEIVVRLKKDGDPVRLLGDLEDRWPGLVAAAEYIPLQTRNGQE